MFEPRGWRLWVCACAALVALTTLCAGKVVHCACSTQHCRSTGSRSCTTQYMCYTQYLDKGDGTNPITTGCISGNTPLLCENRLPAVNHTKWPYLVCCDSSDLCNSGPIPSPPPWGTGNPNSTSPPSDEWDRGPGGALGNSFTLANQPVVLAVLTVGMFLLVVITGFGCYELRRQSRFLQQQGLRGGYMRAQEDCLVAAGPPETGDV